MNDPLDDTREQIHDRQAGDEQWTIRDATREDLPAIVAIYNTTVACRMVTGDLEPVTVEQRLPWFAEHRPDSRPLRVAEVSGEIVGWMSLRPFYGRAAYRATSEVGLYVAAPWRRQGVGRSLLTEGIRRGPELGIRVLLGYILSHNQPSLRLFESVGFETWGQLRDVAEFDGVVRSLTIMGRRVG